MNKTVNDFTFLDDKDTRHLETIPKLGANTMTIQHTGLKTTYPGF